MRKYVALLLSAILLLTGCSNNTALSEAGDFSFEMPDGYSISDKTDRSCSIIRDEDAAVVGGIELTTLNRKDITGSSENVMNYLQQDFHRTSDVEYITSHWGTIRKILTVSLKKYTADGQEEQFSHIFFRQDQGVYHIWLDESLIDSEIASDFIEITGVD